MIEKAKVQGKDPEDVNRYRLLCADSEACQGCAGNMFCRISDKSFSAEAPPALTLEKGDTVEVYFPGKDTVLISFLVLIFPLLGFLLAYFLSSLWGVTQETLQVFIGLAGLLLAGALVYRLLKLPRFQKHPQITKKLSPG